MGRPRITWLEETENDSGGLKVKTVDQSGRAF
jgi:hypothetical protein